MHPAHPALPAHAAASAACLTRAIGSVIHVARATVPAAFLARATAPAALLARAMASASSLACVVLALAVAAPAQERVRVLFLGDRGHHEPAARMHQVQIEMTARGIDLFYTDRVTDLTPERLAHYDCVLLYANHLELPKRHESALLDFVEGGKGFVPVHCASACFPRSRRFVELVGGQFRRHGTGVFAVETALPEHPAVAGLRGFESWDETYVHARLSRDRTVLQFRVEADGRKEPWTWVRRQGKGRVFYTAWGHDQRTWGKAGFHALLERGIRWASGDRFVDRRPPAPEFTFSEAKVPNYRPGVAHRDITNLPTMQDPLAPAASQRRLRVPPEFAVVRFAAEPQIRKPIAMTWDERGRLWIAETVDYPNDQRPSGKGRDRITICEDTDGDGAADRFKVFAEGLSIPTSLVHARGGLIVAQAPQFLFLKDTDGDDRADVREVLMTGWSTSDTHAGPSNLRYGFDNRIWGAVGYAGFKGEVGGERHRFRQGFYRFDSRGRKLEFLISTTNNTWGLGFSEEGHVFGSTANGNPSVYMAIPHRYYEKAIGWSAPRLSTIAESTKFHPITDKVRQVDFHGKFTAAAGHAIYTARSFPRRYWNRAAFVNAPTGHLVHQFFLERQGTHYVTRDGFNLLASDDEWTAPIASEVGPDGAVWVIDWYNYIVQHNPTPRGFETGKGDAYVTPLRDKRHGRIYRIVHRDAVPARSVDLGRASVTQLVATLGDDNLFWRLTAQRLLVERGGADAVPALLSRLEDAGADPLGLNAPVQHALWTLHGLSAIGRIPSATRGKLLGHAAPAVRETAVRLLPPEDIVARTAALLADPEPHVRLATLLVLADAPPSTAVGRQVFAAMRVPANRTDRWLPDAATAAAVQHDVGFLAAALGQFEAKVQRAEPVRNLIPNGDFERDEEDEPVAWKVRHYGGDAEHEYVQEGRNGGWCLKISSTRGADSSFYTDVPLEPDASYRFTGWVKTAGVKRRRGSALGVMFNMHELQGDRPTVRTRGVLGDSDWTRLEVSFDARGVKKVGVNCLFGAWGQASGTAWYDDVRLVKVRKRALSGPLGRAITRVITTYAGRAPVDSVGELLAATRKAAPGLVVSLLGGLASGWPDGKAPRLDEAQRAALRAWLPEMDAGAALDLLRLLKKWRLDAQFGGQTAALAAKLQARVAAAGAPVPDRVIAAARLAELGPLLAADQELRNAREVLAQIEPHTPFELADGIVNALAESSRAEIGKLVVSRWRRFTGRVRASAVRLLLRRAPWTDALLEGMIGGVVDSKALSGAQWLQLDNHPVAAIQAKAATARRDKPSAMRKAVLEKFARVATRRGDAGKGKALFGTHCAKCHSMNGAGGHLGPALDGIGATPRAELLTAILDPNQSVDGTFLMWVVETKAGEFVAGRLDSESRTTIVIRDIDDKTHVIERSGIVSMESSRLSLMPATFEILGEQGLADVLEYLASSRHDAPGKHK